MSREKQIEEMAKVCTNKCKECHNEECRKSTQSQHCIAENLYNASYRKQRVGEWIRVAAFNDGVLNTVKCSACGIYQPLGCWDYHPYCPFCGAKMGGGEDATDTNVGHESEWISVEDRLPEREGKYLTFTIKGEVQLNWFVSFLADAEPEFDYWVTHWMPLPEPPKGV